MSDINFKDFIQDLESINKTNNISIKVPTSSKSLKFKLISVAQHKELLKSAFEGYEGVIRSSVIFNDIITSSCESEYEFSLLDRAPILLKLREASIGGDVTINSEKYNISDLAEQTDKFDAQNVYECNGIEVELKVPTLARDTKVSEKVISEFHKLSDADKETESINLVLSYEIIKYIESVKLNDSVFVFDEYNLYECKKLVDALPLKLNNMIIEFITAFRDHENSSLTFNDGTILEIDASFLSSE